MKEKACWAKGSPRKADGTRLGCPGQRPRRVSSLACGMLHLSALLGSPGLYLQAIAGFKHVKPSVRSSLIARDGQSLCLRGAGRGGAGAASAGACEPGGRLVRLRGLHSLRTLGKTPVLSFPGCLPDFRGEYTGTSPRPDGLTCSHRV